MATSEATPEATSEATPVDLTAGGVGVAPNAGHAISLGSDTVVLKLDGQATGGALAVVEHLMEPGTLGPPYVHEYEHELSYVLAGEIGIRIGDQESRLTPGMYVFKPRGVPHAFWNPGPGIAHVLEVICPAGSKQFFADMARLLQTGVRPNSEEVGLIAGRYHLTFADDRIRAWIPELMAKYQLKPLGGLRR